MDEEINEIYSTYTECKYSLSFYNASRLFEKLSSLTSQLPKEKIPSLKLRFADETGVFLLCEELPSTKPQSAELKRRMENLLKIIQGGIKTPPPTREFSRPQLLPDGMCPSCRESFSLSTKGVSPSYSPLCPGCKLVEKSKCTFPGCPCKGEGKIYQVTHTQGYYGGHIHFNSGFYLYTPVARYATVGNYVARREGKFYKKFYKKLKF